MNNPTWNAVSASAATTRLQLLTLIAALASLHAQAAEPPATIPDAGNLLQQLKPVVPAAPGSSATGLRIERGARAALAPGEAFKVTRLQIAGNTKFSESTLHALIADAEGKSLNLAQLTDVADRLTEYYRLHHYPLARAMLPAQTIKDGVISIQVLEARYGKITLNNQSRVRDSLLSATLAPLQRSDVIEQSEMDHVLLLLADVPKIVVNAVIKPGEAVGTSDLDVTTLAGPRLTGIATVDDYGNHYTGRVRGGGTLSLIDPFGQGDYLSLAGLSSGEDLNYGRLSYETTVTGVGTRLGTSYSALHYKLGDGLQHLEGHGTATVASLWGKQPLLRSQNVNLYAQLQYDRLKLDDALDASAIKTARHLDNWTASLTGDARDGLFSGGVSTWNASVTGGRVGFDNGAAEIADAASAKTLGRFFKSNFTIARLQKLSATNNVYLSFTSQWTHNNLDSSQKLIAGGPYTVRAYDLGVLSGDVGALGTVEFQHEIGSAWHGHWQLAGFVDREHITVNQNQFVAGPDSATLNGAGICLTWRGAHQWNAHTYVAARVGSLPVLVPDSSTVRVWAELNREF